jgi:hypothetical protein
MIRAPKFGSLNHRGSTKRNASGRDPIRHSRAKADINPPPDESVDKLGLMEKSVQTLYAEDSCVWSAYMFDVETRREACVLF